MILTALATGAIAGGGQAAAEAVKDAYDALRDMVRRRLATRRGEAVLDEYERDPETGAAALHANLVEADAQHDRELLEAARRVLAAADQRSTKQTNLQFNAPVHGVVAGDHNDVRMSFGVVREPGNASSDD